MPENYYDKPRDSDDFFEYIDFLKRIVSDNDSSEDIAKCEKILHSLDYIGINTLK